MDNELTAPKTLLEAVRYFADPYVCVAYMAKARWGSLDAVACPTCGSTKVHYLEARRLWQCNTKHPHRQFSVKVGTIFEDSPLGLDKWLPAVWMLTSAKNGVSSYEIARALGITQKSAWFMLHRIRLAMQIPPTRSRAMSKRTRLSLVGAPASCTRASARSGSRAALAWSARPLSWDCWNATGRTRPAVCGSR